MTGFTYGESSGGTFGEASGGTLGVTVAAPTNLTVTAKTATSIDLSWTDNAGGEDKYQLQRRKQVGGQFSAWSVVQTLPPDTTSTTDSTVHPERTYKYRVCVVKSGIVKKSNTVQTTTNGAGVRQRRVPSDGWYVEIDIDT
jgi:hypothetical protein